MSNTLGTLSFFCGKMAAGKSTYARKLANDCKAVLISEDEWLEALYPGKVRCLQSYIEYSTVLKPVVKKLAQSILVSGSNVVLDFPANTLKQRFWFRKLFSEIDAPHQLFFLDRNDEQCLSQLEIRRNVNKAATDTEDMYWNMSQFFEAPTLEEGFSTLTVRAQ